MSRKACVVASVGGLLLIASMADAAPPPAVASAQQGPLELMRELADTVAAGPYVSDTARVIMEGIIGAVEDGTGNVEANILEAIAAAGLSPEDLELTADDEGAIASFLGSSLVSSYLRRDVSIDDVQAVVQQARESDPTSTNSSGAGRSSNGSTTTTQTQNGGYVGTGR